MEYIGCIKKPPSEDDGRLIEVLFNVYTTSRVWKQDARRHSQALNRNASGLLPVALFIVYAHLKHYQEVRLQQASAYRKLSLQVNPKTMNLDCLEECIARTSSDLLAKKGQQPVMTFGLILSRKHGNHQRSRYR